MGATTNIAWCDSTFNPWWGCTRVSAGCEHCYAETFSKRVGLSVWGSKTERRFFGDKHWNEPRKWNAAAESAKIRRRVFCASMADVFEDRRDLDDQRGRLWGLIHETPWLDWLLLTKRPGNVERLRPASWDSGAQNVWIGVTAEDQKRADERIPILTTFKWAAVRFVSYEPALGPVNWCSYMMEGVDWLIVGGESGAGRPFDIQWARNAIDAGSLRGFSVFVKQLGARPYSTEDGDFPADAIEDHGIEPPRAYGQLHSRSGADIAEWPDDVCVREFPQVTR